MTETEQEYFQICAWRFLHPLPKTEYGEVHHVLPKSCGGPNHKWNLVRLTPEEHYRCHCLLPKIFDEKGWMKEKDLMCMAWHFMHITRNGIEITESEYATLKNEWNSAMSAALKRGWTEEKKLALSIARRGKGNPVFGKHWTHTDETKQRMSIGRKRAGGHPQSEETRRKISEFQKNKRKAKCQSQSQQ